MPKKRDRIVRNIQTGIEIRELGNDGGTHILGMIPYGKAANLEYFREIIRPGAFTKTLQEGDCRALWAHNTQYVLGRKSAGTLSLEDREDGLHFDITVPPISWAEDLVETIRRGDAPGVSFGFSVVKDTWTRPTADGEVYVRDLNEVELHEVSVGVAFPAYEDATSEISTRSILSDGGIDCDRIAGIMSRAKEKNDYICKDDEDVRAVSTAIEILEKMIAPQDENRTQPPESTGEKPEESTSPDTLRSTHEDERKRIALAIEIRLRSKK